MISAVAPVRSHSDLAGRHVLVLGLARSGAAAARMLADAGAKALVRAAELVVTSPSISPRFPTTDQWLRRSLLAAEAAGIEVVSEVELFLRLTSARVLAVTGTKGKTTTTALVGSILAAAGMPHAVGGNIGTPL